MTNLKELREEIQQCSDKIEKSCDRLGEILSLLLSLGSEGDSATSLSVIKDIITNLKNRVRANGDETKDLLSEYSTKNMIFFKNLAEQMNSLDSIHDRLEAIRKNSEELELISLNAMVISIKSGEKGRAFSCITENLKRLSASMISLSNELMFKEKKLREKNILLERSFETFHAQYNWVTQTDLVSLKESVFPALDRAREDLMVLEGSVATTFPPIRQAMGGVPSHDIIRNSIDQVLLALKEMISFDKPDSSEEQLDFVSAHIQLLEICEKLLADFQEKIVNEITAFSERWELVHRCVDDVKREWDNFFSCYLDYSNEDKNTLPLLLGNASEFFSGFISRIANFQREQKGMLHASTSIVSEVKYLRNLFETIRPIIARLQHVRITQQIEVAKNEALFSVRGTVEHMSELIYRTESSVEATRKELEVFIAAVESIADTYTEDTKRSNRELTRTRDEKASLLKFIQEGNSHLLEQLSEVRVFPENFGSLYNEVEELLVSLWSIADTVHNFKVVIKDMVQGYRSQRDSLLARSGSNSWTIKNDHIRELIGRFVQTPHEESVGNIDELVVEDRSLDSIDSGDVTLFF